MAAARPLGATGSSPASLAVDPVGAGDVVVDCAGMAGFSGSRLDGELRRRGIDRLAVGGLGLETAVYSTLGAANDRGYECLALTDASRLHDAGVGPRAARQHHHVGRHLRRRRHHHRSRLCDALLEEQP